MNYKRCVYFVEGPCEKQLIDALKAELRLDWQKTDSLSDTELFLNNGFKSIYVAKLVKRILSWVGKKETGRNGHK